MAQCGKSVCACVAVASSLPFSVLKLHKIKPTNDADLIATTTYNHDCHLAQQHKWQMANEQRLFWLMENQIFYCLYVFRLPRVDLSVDLVLKIVTLLAQTQSVDNLIDLFIVLCENEYIIIYDLHYFFTTAFRVL